MFKKFTTALLLILIVNIQAMELTPEIESEQLAKQTQKLDINNNNSLQHYFALLPIDIQDSIKKEFFSAHDLWKQVKLDILSYLEIKPKQIDSIPSDNCFCIHDYHYDSASQLLTVVVASEIWLYNNLQNSFEKKPFDFCPPMLSRDGKSVIYSDFTNHYQIKERNIITSKDTPLLNTVPYIPHLLVEAWEYFVCSKIEGKEGLILIWDKNANSFTQTIKMDSTVKKITFIPKTSLIAVTRENCDDLHLFDINTGLLVHVFLDKKLAAVSPDGQTIALKNNHNAIEIWNVNAMKLVSILQQSKDLLTNKINYRFDYNTEDTLYVLDISFYEGCYEDVWIAIWDVKTGKMVKKQIVPSFLKNITTSLFVKDKIFLQDNSKEMFLIDLMPFNQMYFELESLSLKEALNILIYRETKRETKDERLLSGLSKDLKVLVKKCAL